MALKKTTTKVQETHFYNYAVTDDKTFCGLMLENVNRATSDRALCTCKKCLAMTTRDGQYKKNRTIIPTKVKVKAFAIIAAVTPYLQTYLPYLVALLAV